VNLGRVVPQANLALSATRIGPADGAVLPPGLSFTLQLIATLVQDEARELRRIRVTHQDPPLHKVRVPQEAGGGAGLRNLPFSILPLLTAYFIHVENEMGRVVWICIDAASNQSTWPSVSHLRAQLQLELLDSSQLSDTLREYTAVWFFRYQFQIGRG
jgi:hypothetical protein